jgi:FkbM family methyltransferase
MSGLCEVRYVELLRRRSWFGAKRAIQRKLREVGVEVRKFPSSPFRALSVFHLAVRLLMEKHGTAVSFIQVGANDGVFGDPLRSYIAGYPWRGILVEPQPDVFQRLVQNYQACADRLIFEMAAISRDQSRFTMYKAPADLPTDQTYASSIASGNPQTIARQLKIAPSRLETIVVPALTLDELIAKHSFGDVHVLQIDVEGYDWQVLETIDLRRRSPAIIQFESGHLSNDDCNSAVEHLSRHGYEIYWGGYQGDALGLKTGVLF